MKRIGTYLIVLMSFVPVVLMAKEKELLPGKAIFVMASENSVEEKIIHQSNKYYSIDFKIPQITHLKDKKFQNELNEYLLKDAKIKKEKMIYEAQKGYNHSQLLKQTVPMYQFISNYHIKPTIKPYYIIEQFEYIYTGGFKGETDYKYVVVDTEKNKVISLKDLFKEDIDYESLLCEKLQEKMPSDLEIKCKEQLDYWPFYINARSELVFMIHTNTEGNFSKGNIILKISLEDLKDALNP